MPRAGNQESSMGLINKQMGAPADDESQEDPREEATESPAVESQEDAQEPDEQGGAQDGGEQPDGDAGDDNPAYQAALKFAHDALYKNGAAKDVARAIATAQDPVEARANTAYDMVSTVDEKTNGEVPDELVVSLATDILGEVADIAEAAGVKVKGEQIAGAMQKMLVRYVTENGGDASQLQAAMSQADPAKVGAALDKHAGV